MDPLAKRRLGKSGVELPLFGFGGAPLGELFVKVTEADAEATLQAAWDEGVRYYDTAPWYGRGQSEHRFGRFLYRQPRAEFVLSTKVGRVLKAPRNPERFDQGFWSGGLQFDHVFDYSYDAIMRAYEDCLQRLGMNRIDLLVIHDLDFWHHATEPKVQAYLGQLIGGGWRALEELRSGGQIKAIGAGINELGMMPRFLDLFDIDFFLVALRYTLMEHDTLDGRAALLRAARRRHHHRRRVLVRRHRHRGRARRQVQLRRRDARGAGQGPPHPGGVRAPRRAAAGGGAAVPVRPPERGLGHSRAPSAPTRSTANLGYFRHAIPAAFWQELRHERLIRADAPLPNG